MRVRGINAFVSKLSESDSAVSTRLKRKVIFALEAVYGTNATSEQNVSNAIAIKIDCGHVYLRVKNKGNAIDVLLEVDDDVNFYVAARTYNELNAVLRIIESGDSIDNLPDYIVLTFANRNGEVLIIETAKLTLKDATVLRTLKPSDVQEADNGVSYIKLPEENKVILIDPETYEARLVEYENGELKAENDFIEELVKGINATEQDLTEILVSAGAINAGQSVSDTIANILQTGENNHDGNQFTRLLETSRRLLEERSWSERSRALDETLRRRLSGVLRLELGRRHNSETDGRRANEWTHLKLKSKYGDINIYGNVDGQTFHDVFEIVRTYLKNGELVDLHNAKTSDDEIGYNDTENYLSEDGLSGFSITKEGDLISVFNNSDRRGWLKTIASNEEIMSRIKTLDAYDSNQQSLPAMYKKALGMKVASLMDWNQEYDHDGIGDNHGNPKVAFMVKTDDEVIVRTFGKDDYDEAVAYRDSYLAKTPITETQENAELSLATQRNANAPAQLVKDSTDLRNEKAITTTKIEGY